MVAGYEYNVTVDDSDMPIVGGIPATDLDITDITAWECESCCVELDARITALESGALSFVNTESGTVPISPATPATAPTIAPGREANLQEHWIDHNETLWWKYDGAAWSLEWRDPGQQRYILTTEAELSAFLALTGDRTALVTAVIPITQRHQVPPEASIAFKQGGIFDFTDPTSEIDWQGTVQAGRYRIFTNFTGAGVTQAYKVMGRMGGTERYPEWWGARADYQSLKQESGAHDGADGVAVLTNSLANWTVNQWVGYEIFNHTDGSFAHITANTATTITAALDGGDYNVWDAGDSYSIWTSYGSGNSVGDGSSETDSTEGIQYAVNSGFSSGSTDPTAFQTMGPVLLASGGYKITAPIECQNRVCYLKGQGVFRTTIFPYHPTTGFSAIRFGATSGQDWGCYEQKFSDFYIRWSIDAPGAGWTGLTGVDDVGEGTEIHSIWAVGWTTSGVSISSNANVLGLWIHDCSFNSSSANLAAESVAIYLGNSGDQVTIDRITCNNNTIRPITTRAFGEHDGAAGATLIDSTAAFDVDKYVGYTVVNKTDGSYGVITANTATTVTAVLSGGGANTWTPADEYTIQDTLLPNRWTRIFRNTGVDCTAGGMRTGSWADDNDVDTVWLTDATIVGAPILSNSSSAALIQIEAHGGSGHPSAFPEWNHAAVFAWGTNGFQVSESHFEGFENAVKIGGTAIIRGTGIASGFAGGLYEKIYTGDGAQVAFDTLMNFPTNSSVSVYVDDVLYFESVDYSLTGEGGSSGGTVTFNRAPANGEVVRITVNQLAGPVSRAHVSDLHVDGCRCGVKVHGLSNGVTGSTATTVNIEGIHQGITPPGNIDLVEDADTGIILGAGPGATNVVSAVASYIRQNSIEAAPGPYDLVWEVGPEGSFSISESLDAVTGAPGELTIDAKDFRKTVIVDFSNANASGVNLSTPARDGQVKIIRGRQVPLGSTICTIDATNISGITQEDETITPSKSAGTGTHTDPPAVPEVSLTIVTQATVGDKFTIGVKEYTFVTNGTASADGQIDVGTDLATCQLAIVAAINGSDAHNFPHPSVTAGAFAANVSLITEPTPGGSSIQSTTRFLAAGNVFSSPTLRQTMTDAAATFVAGDLTKEVHTIYNTTDGSSAVIVANTATTVTVETLTGGTDFTFDTADAYIVVKRASLKLQTNGSKVTLVANGGQWHWQSGVDAYISGQNPSPVANKEIKYGTPGSPAITTLDKHVARFDLSSGSFTPSMGRPEFDGQIKIIYTVNTTGPNTVTLNTANCNIAAADSPITFGTNDETVALIGISGEWFRIGGDA